MRKIYTTTYVNAISLICTLIVFLIINFMFYIVRNPSIFSIGFQNDVRVKFQNSDNTNGNYTDDGNNQKQGDDANLVVEAKAETELNTTNSDITKKSWYISIPRIFLEAEVSEGTSKEVLNVYVGHFEESAKTDGNVCLAAHNRGYPVNYFQNLKLLKKGDIVEYRYNDFKKEYVVTENSIIEDTDWTYLQNADQNMITLITCIENEPEYRRCVRAEEKVE